MLEPKDFFDLHKSKHRSIFQGIDRVWDGIRLIPEYIKANLKPSIEGDISPIAHVEENVAIGAGTVVEPGAIVKGNTIVGENCQIRAGAYIRGNVIVGARCTVGHTTELKNCLLFDDVELPHFVYVGDSILGWRCHLGAGVKVSNLKVDRTSVKVKIDDRIYDTGLVKFGAIIGDRVEIGCNCVLNPGTFIGQGTLAYANSSLRGYYLGNSIIKLRQSYEIVERRKT